jgi:hypothetical protein
VGFAPRLFHVTETVDPSTPESNVFVAPVTYGDRAGRIKQRQAIGTALDIIMQVAQDPT